MRIFLRLYLLLVLPLVLLAILPVNPISMVGNWWWEKIAVQEFGAIYPLVLKELEGLPQEQWKQKVATISEHFAYSLTLKKVAESKLQPSRLKRLDKQEYVLTINTPNVRLVHKVEDTDFLLFIGIDRHETEESGFEEATRGYRYFLDKITHENDHPEKAFEHFKSYFGVKLTLIKASDFQSSNPKVMDILIAKGLHYRGQDRESSSFILSGNKKYVIEIAANNNLSTIRKYYKYLSTLLPAVLLGIGALFWLLLFRKELNTLKTASSALGKGELQTRTNLSKNSTLYELSNSFNQMAGRIEQLLEDHKDLTNAVSHELKTPISRLRFALEMQQESLEDQDKKHYTQQIENNIQTLQDLIDELLSYTRMQREQDIDLQKHSVREWILHELNLFADYHPEIRFEHDIQVEKEVLFDRIKMTRVLNNLLDNAVKHCQSTVKVSSVIQSKEIVLNVEDDGAGIAAKDCKKVFEPFTRLDKSRQRISGGYGLGLAIVKSIVQSHKGRVGCQPSALGGAAFIVRWPKE